MTDKKLFNSKRTDMCLAALLILIFHLWISVFKGNAVENFIVKTGYIGVDIFLLLSVYTLSLRPITDLKSFYIGRFKSVYLKFALFVVIASIINHWKVLRAFKSLTMVELFEKGGGAFLWFLPAIVILYFLFPLVDKILKFKPWVNALIVLLVWLAVGLIISRFSNYNAIFIFLNRVPIMVVGYLLARYEGKIVDKGMGVRVAVAVLLLIAGIILTWKFGYKVRLNSPITDMFYVVTIPYALGLTLLVDLIPECRFTRLLGRSTLEAYAVQMIWGYKMAAFFYKFSKSAIITNLLTIICVLGLSMCVSSIFMILFNIKRAK